MIANVNQFSVLLIRKTCYNPEGMILIEKWKFKISRGNKMATYYEFKKIIGKIFGCGNIEENEDDIDVVIQNRHYPREEAIYLILQLVMRNYKNCIIM